MNKFEKLWNAGQQATFHFETKSWEAKIIFALGSLPNNVPEKKIWYLVVVLLYMNLALQIRESCLSQ